MRELLSGKVALMTGSLTPLALTVARRLGNEGVRIAFVGRRISLDTAVQALLCQFRHESLCFDADLTDPACVEEVLCAVERAFGAVDLVIHTLGVPVPHAETREHGLVIRNSTEPIATALSCTAGAINHMKRRRSGHILHLIGGEQIGALEVDRRALSALQQVRIGSGSYVALSAVFFDESASLRALAPQMPDLRVLESFVARTMMEDDWAQQVLLDRQVGDLVVRVCVQPAQSLTGSVHSFGLGLDAPAVQELSITDLSLQR
jgi:hypothetical protein